MRQAYDWPGNVRQLENVCRRLALIASGREIRVADLPPNLKTEPAETASGWTQALAAWVEQELAQDRDDLHARAQAELERVLFAAALARCDGHRQNAARVLGLCRNTLTRKLGSSRRRKPR